MKKQSWEERIRAGAGEELLPLGMAVLGGSRGAGHELVGRVLANDQEAQRLFHLLFYNALVHVCEQVTKDRHLAEDAASEANEYLLLKGGLERFQERQFHSLAVWVYQAGRWRAGDILARHRRQSPKGNRVLAQIAEEFSSAERMEPPSFGCDTEWNGNEENEVADWIRTASNLGEVEKRIFALRYEDGMTLEEAAEAMKMSVSSVRRAQSRLKSAIYSNAELFYTHWAPGRRVDPTSYGELREPERLVRLFEEGLIEERLLDSAGEIRDGILVAVPIEGE